MKPQTDEDKELVEYIDILIEEIDRQTKPLRFRIKQFEQDKKKLQKIRKRIK